MKIDKIYRLIYSGENGFLTSSFFTKKEEALNYLSDIKEDIHKLYEDYDNAAHPLGEVIRLQSIDLYEVEDIDFYADDKEVSEWVYDKDFTEDYQKDMAEAGICTEEVFGMWKDYEVKG